MEDKFIVAIVGIGSVTVIGCVCVARGMDGALIGTVCTLIGTMVGYVFGKKTNGEK